jgi:hypothetical protein
MSSRPFLKPHVVANAVSMAASVTSDVTIIQMIPYISYTVVWTGTPTGTFAVEVSNDYSVDASGAVLNAGTWVALTLSASVAAAGSADSAFIDIDGVAAYAIRLKYTRASGTGSLTATVAGKVL